MKTTARFQKDFDQEPVNIHYRSLVDGLLYGSVTSQNQRHENALRYFNFRNKSLLDVGCGRGDFVGFLSEKHIKPVAYLGLDPVTELLEQARTRYPKRVFNDTDYLSQKFNADVIVAFSVFDRRFGNITDSKAFTFKMVEKMVAEADEGVYITFLSAHKIIDNPAELLFYPQEIFEFARTLTERVVLDCSYMPNCFSIIMYTQPSVWRQNECPFVQD